MEDELAGKSDKASFNTTVGDATFTFLFRLLTGKDPTETKIGIDGPILVQTWLAAPKLMVFLFQKSSLYKCNMAGKPAVLTRVVDSMTDNLRPTRVEATGVANAILDGSDAILLGAETLRGLYPVEIISTVGRICSEVHKLVISSQSERPI